MHSPILWNVFIYSYGSSDSKSVRVWISYSWFSFFDAQVNKNTKYSLYSEIYYKDVSWDTPYIWLTIYKP